MRKKLTYPTLIIFIALSICLMIQDCFATQWAKTYGGSSLDYASSIRQTQDGGYIVAGGTVSFGADYHDFWVLKLHSDGAVNWQKRWGGTYRDNATDIKQTSDGGYIVVGDTASFGAGSSDFWVLKLDSDGTVSWQKTYGRSSDDSPCTIQQTTDGGYIVAGRTRSSPQDCYDFWVLKLDSDGTVSWQKTYGRSIYANNYARSIQQTTDDGYIVAGSYDGGWSNGWVLKLNSSGSVTWQKIYNEGYIRDIRQTQDGGYIVAGQNTAGFLVFKLNSSGIITWQKTYGMGSAFFISQTSDGEYIVTGEYMFDTLPYFKVLKIDGNGDVTWHKIYGGMVYNYGDFSIQQTFNESGSPTGYIMIGTTLSGAGDLCLIKYDNNGEIPNCDIMRNSGLIVSDTSFEGQGTNAIIQSPSFTITDTNITPQDTLAEINTICSSVDFDYDGIVDEEDNCWKYPNPEQDPNGDCPEDPPYSSDPHCGDACTFYREGYRTFQCGENTASGDILDTCLCKGYNPYPCCNNCSMPPYDHLWYDTCDGNCTWWAWNMACCNWGEALPGTHNWGDSFYTNPNWGNANSWLNAAREYGYFTGIIPVDKSIFVNEIVAPVGHVGWVFNVVDNELHTTEMNCGYINQYTNENGLPNINQGYRTNRPVTYPSGYIYFNLKWPVIGDWDGDGTDTFALYHDWNFQTVDANSNPVGEPISLGKHIDRPVVGDWDGDGDDDIGFYRPREGTPAESKFYLDINGNGIADQLITFDYHPEYIPIAGDWDGDGDDDIGGYDPVDSTFHLYALSGTTAILYDEIAFGNMYDMPIIGDWNGDGDDDIGVFRPFDPNINRNRLYFKNLDLPGTGHNMCLYQYGKIGDFPIAGDFDGDGDDDIGYYRPSTGFFSYEASVPVNFPAGDSDGDGLEDYKEDTNCNGVYEPELGESDAYDDETDDDGLVDGNTGSEDFNANGIVDPGETDPRNPDTDGDGIYDGTERGLTEPESVNTDLSAGFFIPDADPFTTTEPDNSDTDGDNLSDGEEDINKDGAVDSGETDPNNPDTDGDDYNDGVEVSLQADPLNPDSTPPDVDDDRVPDLLDNCQNDYNPDQADTDGDCVGDVCDPFPDTYDITQIDTDNDGIGDPCDECTDSDGDEYGDPGFPNNTCGQDMCPYDYTTHHCEEDSDTDNIGDICDNCPNTPNPDQLDTYPPHKNGIGDACECEADFTCDGDVDADDVTTFLEHFGREPYYQPCTSGDPCIGDFDCDADVDADDVTKFLEDFGREQYYNPCPACEAGNWCEYE